MDATTPRAKAAQWETRSTMRIKRLTLASPLPI